MAVNISLFALCLGALFFTVSYGYSINRNNQDLEETKVELKRLLLCLLDKKSCQGEPHLDQRVDMAPPDRRVYLNGVVYTVDKFLYPNWDAYPKEVIVIDKDKIKFVGTNEQAEAFITDNSEVYDLHGSAVLPGLHDVHMHPLEAMSRIGGACVLPYLKRPDTEEFANIFATCPGNRVGTNWLLGGGFSVTLMMEYVEESPNNSPKKLLDKYVPDRPAAMISETSHSIWVNSKALELAGIDSKTPESPGTVIMREPGSNEPNGIIFENGAMIVMEIAMDPDQNESILKLTYDGLLDALHQLSKNGITSICDARLFWKIKHNLAWEKACEDGALTVRAVLGAWAYPAENDNHQIQKLKDMWYDDSEGCSLKISQIKVYMDGIVQSTTAAMEDHYKINLSLPIISDKNIGMNYFDRHRLEKYLRALQDFGDGKGYDFHIHAIGDRGIREALDAIEAAAVGEAGTDGPTRHPRHRLTHLEIVDDYDISRFRSLGVIADFQVAGEFALPAEHASLAEFVGMKKARASIPVKRVSDDDAVVTLSSDWDVSPLNPFLGIQHAAQRGGQSVSVKKAIEMYTANPAYAMRQEQTVGSLEEGKDADIIIIDQDILDIPVKWISYTRVLQTVFKGNIIHETPNGIIEDVTDYYQNRKKKV